MEPEENVSLLHMPKSFEVYVVPIVFAIIFIVGLLGNVILIITFLRNKTMRNAPNTFIVSLALADLIAILTCVPFFSIIYTVFGWPYGESMCKILMSINEFSFVIRPLMLTVLATERFIAIVVPFRLTVGSSVKVAAIFWGLAIIWAIPTYLRSYVHSYTRTREHGSDVYKLHSERIDTCRTIPNSWDHHYLKTYILTQFVLFYVVPLTVIVVFYVLITRHLVWGPKMQNEQQNNSSKNVAITVFTFVVNFAICTLPIYIYLFWIIFDEKSYEYIQILHYLHIFGFCLDFLSLCANPVVFYCLNEQFRKLFNRYILCKCEKNQDEQETPMIFQYSVLSEQTTIIQPNVEQVTSLPSEKNVSNTLYNEINCENEEYNV